MTVRCELYGLVIESDRPLYRGALPVPADAAPDVTIRHSPNEVASRGPGSDDLELHYEQDDFAYFCERAADGSYALVFTDACEFEISPDLRQVTVYRHRGAVAGIEDVLASGAQMAWQLYMRGFLVLHASAVQVGGAAVAFVGGSGRGKSTMATLMCSAGARILTDDLLRVDLAEDGPLARLGSSELRLRKGADTLAAAFGDAPPSRRTSADDRSILQPDRMADDSIPLRAIYVPAPTHDDPAVRIDRIVAADSLFALMRFPRLLGWKEPGVRTRQFALSAQLLQKVPFSLAYVPWGPPFSDTIAAEILADLDRDREPRSLRFDRAPS